MSKPPAIEWDFRDLRKGAREFQKRVRRATMRAGAEAIRKTKTEVARRVRARKAIKAATIKKGLVLRFPPPGTDTAAAEWRINVSTRPIPMGAYPIRQTRTGVTVQINRGASKLVRGAFIATMKSGHRGVFMRRGKARLPLKELYSSRISDVVRDTGFLPEVEAFARVKFQSAFRRLLQLEIGNAPAARPPQA